MQTQHLQNIDGLPWMCALIKYAFGMQITHTGSTLPLYFIDRQHLHQQYKRDKQGCKE